MGQKTHPIGFRLGVIKSWNSKWFADKSFGDLIIEDSKIKKYINTRLDNAGLAKVEILRAPKKVTVDIHTSRPGIVIGRKGAEVDKLREELQLLTGKDISLNIIEVKRPELNARLVADSISNQLMGRVSYRRAMKKAIMATMKMGADGIKILCSGRLAGAEIARSEKYMEGRVPLHTLRADIDYATSTARTTYGTIGVKVWICRGEVHDSGEMDRKDDDKPDRPELEMGGRKDRKRRDGGRRGPRGPRGRVKKQGGGRGPQQRGDRKPQADTGRGPQQRGDKKPQADSGRGGSPKAAHKPGGKPKAEDKGAGKPKKAESKKPAPDKKKDSSASSEGSDKS